MFTKEAGCSLCEGGGLGGNVAFAHFLRARAAACPLSRGGRPAGREPWLYNCAQQRVSNSKVWTQAHQLPSAEPVEMSKRKTFPRPCCRGHGAAGPGQERRPLKALVLPAHTGACLVQSDGWTTVLVGIQMTLGRIQSVFVCQKLKCLSPISYILYKIQMIL